MILVCFQLCGTHVIVRGTCVPCSKGNRVTWLHMVDSITAWQMVQVFININKVVLSG